METQQFNQLSINDLLTELYKSRHPKVTKTHTWYHGTTKANADKIKSEGLKPNPAHHFKVSRPFDTEGLEYAPDHVYITPRQKTAKDFAIFRTQYERSPEGTIIDKSDLGRNLIKQTSEVDASAEPAIVQFELPDSVTSSVVWDIDSDPEMQAFVYHGAIPAQYVKSVKPIPYAE